MTGLARYCAANVPQVVVTVAAKAIAPFGFTVPLPGVTATENDLLRPDRHGRGRGLARIRLARGHDVVGARSRGRDVGSRPSPSRHRPR